MSYRSDEFKHLREIMRDGQGRHRTQSLFWELRREGTEETLPPVFTTKDRDHTVKGVTYLSLKKIYMSYDHIPEYEYEFAQDVFGSWEGWRKLSEDSQIKNLIKDWRDELEIKILAKAMKTMVLQSKDIEKGYQSAKFILEKGYKGNKRGRPSKEEISRELQQQTKVRETLQEDMKRLGLSIVNGEE